MDYGPFFSATLEVARATSPTKESPSASIPAKAASHAATNSFFLKPTRLRAAALWTGPEFIDWKNIAFDGTHEVHASIVGETLLSNPDAPGWADANDSFEEKRIQGRDGARYGPLPRTWAHWRGLYVHGDRVVLSYEIGGTEVLESPGAEGDTDHRRFSRSFDIGPRARPLLLQVAQGSRRPFGDKHASAGHAGLAGSLQGPGVGRA